jgi:hypothetical protein
MLSRLRTEEERSATPDRTPTEPPNWFRVTDGVRDVNSKKLRASNASFARTRHRREMHPCLDSRRCWQSRLIHGCSGLRPELRLEFRCSDRRLEYERAERQVVGGDAVDQKPDGFFTIAADIECQRPTSDGLAENPVWTAPPIRNEQAEIDEVRRSRDPDLLTGHHMANRAAGAIDER